MKKLGLLLLLCQLSCTSQAPEKINGVSFVAAPEKVTQKQVNYVLNINANHAAVMPFGFVKNVNSPEVIYNTERQWFGETFEGAKQYIQMLHKNKIQVMLKPQIWVWRGEFTGTIKMNSEKDWKKLEDSYENFILSYAKLAEETKVNIFCIGTELELFVKNRPDYWQNLIKKIRYIYKGKLTYAANWDEYTRTSFWKQLDYIGVDAYFPLSDTETPTVVELEDAWMKWKPKLKQFSQTYDKPVLFTEFGYRSMNYTAKKPWLVDRNDEKVNLQAQSNATQAIFNSFWKEDWFKGGYVWKWFINHDKRGGINDNRFTPQNKPTEQIIKDFYSLN